MDKNEIKDICREIIRNELKFKRIERCDSYMSPTYYYLEVYLGEELISEVLLGDDGYVYDG